MIKLNKKGMSSIEILLAFVLASIIMVTLFNVVFVYKAKQQTESVKNELEVYMNTLTKTIQNDMLEKGIESVNIYPVTKPDGRNHENAESHKIEITYKRPSETKVLEIIKVPNLNVDSIKAPNLPPDAIDEEFIIIYDGIEYPIPAVGKYDYRGKQTYDLKINEIRVSDSNEMFELYIGFIHPDLGTDYSIKIVNPIGLEGAGVNECVTLLASYPQGSIFVTTDFQNPTDRCGGEWAAWGTGRTPIGVDTNVSDFNVVEKVGGAKVHSLTNAELPSHAHSIPALSGTAASAGAHTHGLNPSGNYTVCGYDTEIPNDKFTGIVATAGTVNYRITRASATNSDGAHTHPTFNTDASTTGSSGSSTAHNNLQPYITVYMWKRLDSSASSSLTEQQRNEMFLYAHPTASIFMSASSDNPGVTYGGTWELWGSGQAPVGVDTGQTEFNTVEKTGGVKTHTLTTAELPSHTHSIPSLSGTAASAGAHTHRPGVGSAFIHLQTSTATNKGYNTGTSFSAAPGTSTATRISRINVTASGGAHTHTVSTPATTSGSVGSGGAHNNLQPYITVYMWKRTDVAGEITGKAKKAFLSANPVGSILRTVNGTDPGTIYGGEWVSFGKGRVLVGVDSGQEEFYTVEKTGGAKTHTLTGAELPAHNHSIPALTVTIASAGAHTHGPGRGTWFMAVKSGNDTTLPDSLPDNTGVAQNGGSFGEQGKSFNDYTISAGAHTHTVTTAVNTSGSVGTGNAHNNIGPYITNYMWKRTQ